MIRITGNGGEGAGLLTNLAIEKLLETQPQCLCFLIDDTTEFSPLINKLQGVNVKVSPGFLSTYEEYTEYVISRLDKGKNFFRFIFDYDEYHFENKLETIEKFANILETLYHRKVFLIYKSVYESSTIT